MSQQAANLRPLVSPSARLAARGEMGPRTLVVSSGKAGVGATTLAVNLATALAGDALRVVLVDADRHRADVAAHCNLNKSLDIGDVLEGRKSVHEALQRGPAGIQVLAGSKANDTWDGVNERSIQRMMRHLRSLAPHADWLIIDAGHQPSALISRFWHSADGVLLVTSPDAAVVMDTYALVKTLLPEPRLAKPLALIVNQVRDALTAADVHRRIDQSCRRFLGLSVELAGAVPWEASAAERGEAGPAVFSDPGSPLAEAVSRLAREIAAAPRDHDRMRKAG